MTSRAKHATNRKRTHASRIKADENTITQLTSRRLSDESLRASRARASRAKEYGTVPKRHGVKRGLGTLQLMGAGLTRKRKCCSIEEAWALTLQARYGPWARAPRAGQLPCILTKA